MRVASLFVIAALPALSLAQSVDSLSSEVPFCALGPLSIAAGENNCNMDATCLCKDQTFITSLTKKVEAACSKEELDKVVSLATGACKTAGVTIAVPVDNSTDSSAANPSWGERSSTVNLVMVVGVMGLAAQAVL
ncbi:hypothetical protein V500_07519 [Pseudogymnoascus sp. VKM F-4518 (FW-2643)]|nr:hypothetical protein V500_07519 [Pseudogymnoascus sp. VKM F-4518 (FW-2643)]